MPPLLLPLSVTPPLLHSGIPEFRNPVTSEDFRIRFNPSSLYFIVQVNNKLLFILQYGNAFTALTSLLTFKWWKNPKILEASVWRQRCFFSRNSTWTRVATFEYLLLYLITPGGGGVGGGVGGGGEGGGKGEGGGRESNGQKGKSWSNDFQSSRAWKTVVTWGHVPRPITSSSALLLRLLHLFLLPFLLLLSFLFKMLSNNVDRLL